MRFVYVMTDYAGNNISFWRQYSYFDRFIKKGVLDFAIFDVQSTESILITACKISPFLMFCSKLAACVGFSSDV